MSIEADPFVPGTLVQELSSAENEAATRRKARERALQILGGGDNCKKEPYTDSDFGTAGPVVGSTEATSWAMDTNTEATAQHSDKHVQGKGVSRAGEQELRVDPTDGLLYCKADFVLEYVYCASLSRCCIQQVDDDSIVHCAWRRYGGTVEWDEALTAQQHLMESSKIRRLESISASEPLVPELEPEPEPEPMTSYPLYISGSDSDDQELEPATLAMAASGSVETRNAACMAQLLDMGFHRDLARQALQVHPDSVEAAAAWLLQDMDELDKRVHKDSHTPTSRQDEEQRVDPTDGNAYTKAEFVDAYGGLDEWHAAVPIDSSRVGVAACSQGRKTCQASISTNGEPESLEAYVLRGLEKLGVDDDLCDYFAGMLNSMALSSDSSTDESFDEGVDNLVELLVDGYDCDNADVRSFITGAPGLASERSSKRNTQWRDSKSSNAPTVHAANGVGVTAAGRRVRELPSARKMNVGIEVTDWVDPEDQPWA